MLDGDIDQVLEFVLRTGRLSQGMDHHAPRRGTIRPHLEVVADCGKVPLLRAGAVVCVDDKRGGRSTGGVGDVHDDRLRRISQRHRPTQALVELQQHQERELRRGASGSSTSQ